LRYRFGYHSLAIAVVAAALVGGSFSRSAAAVQATPEMADQPDTAQPAQLALALTAPVTAPVAAANRTDDQSVATVTFDPRVGLPQWLRAVKDLSLWSSGESSASATGTVPALSSYVKPLGPFTDGRVEVYFPGDADHAAEQGWIDTTAVEPSGVPPWIDPPTDADGLPAPPLRTSDASAPDTTAYHIAIIDDASGQLIYGEQPYTEVPQASTTKIATTIVALERTTDLSQRINVTVSASAMVARDGSSTMGIEPGRTVSLSTLLHGMMLPSGNDAAEQVALSLGGSRERYVEWMNEEAAALGLKDTHFVNPSGMDVAGHYSSAYDMAMLARYAMHNATFRELAAATTYSGDGFKMSNLNRLLGVYPGADGVKIGYTDAAQKTIVASAVHDGHRVFISLMHSEDLPGDCTALFNWVWDSFTW
jgi:D-alanyl-D-alanine carboxypeptidase-like protein